MLDTNEVILICKFLITLPLKSKLKAHLCNYFQYSDAYFELNQISSAEAR